MNKADPRIRTLYQFICRDCGKESVTRFPYNPMTDTPDLVQSVPEGWMLVHDGNNPQTPVAVCPDCIGAEAPGE